MPVNQLPDNPYWTHVDEIFDDREGTPFSATKNSTFGLTREYTRRFRVIVKQVAMSSLAVCSCPGLPLPYSPYQSGNGLEYDLNALCISLHAQEENKGDWKCWVVTATYSTDVPPGGMAEMPGWPAGGGTPGSPHQGGQSTNPELVPPDIEWDFETAHTAIPHDRDGKAFLNSARQPFTPAPMFDEAVAVLVYSRNELTWSRLKATKYAFAVNKDPFLGTNPGQVMCMPPKAKLSFLGNLNYWRITYRFKFVYDPLAGAPGNILGFGFRTWQPRLLDQGLCRLQDQAGAPNKGEPIPILRNNLHPVTQPVLLDGKGQPKRPSLRQIIPPGGGVPINEEFMEPVYLNFNVYKEELFARLLLRGLN